MPDLATESSLAWQKDHAIPKITLSGSWASLEFGNFSRNSDLNAVAAFINSDFANSVGPFPSGNDGSEIGGIDCPEAIYPSALKVSSEILNFGCVKSQMDLTPR